MTQRKSTGFKGATPLGYADGATQKPLTPSMSIGYRRVASSSFDQFHSSQTMQLLQHYESNILVGMCARDEKDRGVWESKWVQNHLKLNQDSSQKLRVYNLLTHFRWRVSEVVLCDRRVPALPSGLNQRVVRGWEEILGPHRGARRCCAWASLGRWASPLLAWVWLLLRCVPTLRMGLCVPPLRVRLGRWLRGKPLLLGIAALLSGISLLLGVAASGVNLLRHRGCACDVDCRTIGQSTPKL